MGFMKSQIHFSLPEKDIPKQWYNLLADFPEPLPPPLHPGTKQPVPPEALLAIFPENLVQQEMCPDRWVEIPEAVREIYALWRPTPLLRAVRLEQALQTPAHIYYKYEGASPAGSHKPNTAVAQAYFNKVAGTKRLATETGAGQWGSSLALACQLFGLECNVYMVKVSYEQKPYRRMLMHTWGATVHPSPSDQTEFGRKLLAEDPHCPGSLGIAISEAIEDTVTHPNTKYSLGSVLNHVCLHQTVIGQEAIQQMEMAGEEPDSIYRLLRRRQQFRRPGLSVPAQEDHGEEEVSHRGGGTLRLPVADQGRIALRFRRHGGDDAAADDVHAGPRVHAAAHPCGRAALSRHVAHGQPRAQAGFDRGRGRITRPRSSRPATLFARTEGIVPAPESAHAIAAVVEEAEQAREAGQEARHPVQSLRPRPARPERLRNLPHGKIQDV